MGTIKLLIVDDHVMFREGLARSLDREPGFEVAGQFSSFSEAWLRSARTPPPWCCST